MYKIWHMANGVFGIMKITHIPKFEGELVCTGLAYYLQIPNISKENYIYGYYDGKINDFHSLLTFLRNANPSMEQYLKIREAISKWIKTI